MDIIYQLGQASVADVLDKLPDPPGYNSVRVLLNILEKKGYLTHHKKGQKYIYAPVELPDKTKNSALDHIVNTFFGGSTPRAVSALLDADLSKGELDELAAMIEKAKQKKEDGEGSP